MSKLRLFMTHQTDRSRAEIRNAEGNTVADLGFFYEGNETARTVAAAREAARRLAKKEPTP